MMIVIPEGPLFVKLKVLNGERSMDLTGEVGSTESMDNNQLKCGINHILEAKEKGETNEDNVRYIAKNINVEGMPSPHS
ncbi:putative trans-cinnamate 4-monooxygenase [Helianthus anomalus]